MTPAGSATLFRRVAFVAALGSPLALFSLHGCGAKASTPTPTESVTDADMQPEDGGLVPHPQDLEAGACPPRAPSAELGITWQPPPPLAQARCPNRDTMKGLLLCRLTTGQDPSQCTKEYLEQLADCWDCLASSETAAHWGPLVQHGNLYTLNQGGCIAAFEAARPTHLSGAPDPLGPDGCGALLARREACALSACRESCAGFPNPALESCMATARAGACVVASKAAAACSDPLLRPGAVAAACNTTVDFIDTATAYGALFCMAPDADAGADGAADASVDANDDAG